LFLILGFICDLALDICDLRFMVFDLPARPAGGPAQTQNTER
jgi:hypothetical protein